MSILTGKVAIITGASSGIGYAAASLFAREGASVVVAARRQSNLQSLVSRITDFGGHALEVVGDVRDEGFAEALVGIAESKFGGLDIAFNNAGILGPMTPTVDASLDSWKNVLETNLTSGFLSAKYQIPAMLRRGGGSLLFTSSFVGYSVGFPGMSSYAASKAGLIGLVKSLAAEYGAQSIRVNALLPGGTDTDMAREFGDTPDTVEFVKQLHALKRIASPEEIAQAALFLSSPASSFITGSAMLVDGGASICRN